MLALSTALERGQWGAAPVGSGQRSPTRTDFPPKAHPAGIRKCQGGLWGPSQGGLLKQTQASAPQGSKRRAQAAPYTAWFLKPRESQVSSFGAVPGSRRSAGSIAHPDPLPGDPHPAQARPGQRAAGARLLCLALGRPLRAGRTPGQGGPGPVALAVPADIEGTGPTLRPLLCWGSRRPGTALRARDGGCRLASCLAHPTEGLSGAVGSRGSDALFQRPYILPTTHP